MLSASLNKTFPSFKKCEYIQVLRNATDFEKITIVRSTQFSQLVPSLDVPWVSANSKSLKHYQETYYSDKISIYIIKKS